MKANTKAYLKQIPELAKAARHEEVFWLNDRKLPEFMQTGRPISEAQLAAAEQRFLRFAPYLAEVFPETRAAGGLIESPLKEIGRMKHFLAEYGGEPVEGRLFLKMDSHLPIAGSIKARGGIYEVLKHAEELAVQAGILREGDDYRILAGQEAREFFNRYTVQVGSTGNLGMSIGIMSAKLGFRVIVHMSADAKQWKKDLLRRRGVTVLEYPEDYCAAVEEGRRNSAADPTSYFVDDENSVDLFLGYSVAGKRLQAQLAAQKIKVDEEHPLFVYLPCGIGGAPGGVAYGLKEVYGDAVHCFFTEPAEACCMLVGMVTGEHDGVCVQDFGISGKTEADGLAVGRPSGFVGKVIDERLSGICTIQDEKLYDLMRGLMKSENIFIEPSACAAFAAMLHLDVLREYCKKQGLGGRMDRIVHVAWATGGSMAPAEEAETYLKK